MEVILLEKVGKWGDLGDKVNVKAGYGRNFLIPQGKAVAATEENIKTFEARRAELEKAAAEKLAAAEARAEQVNGLELTIATQAGDEGKLFGSIGPRDIAERATEANVTLEKSEVRMPEGPIRSTGEFDVHVQLHPEVFATLKVIVVPEE